VHAARKTEFQSARIHHQTRFMALQDRQLLTGEGETDGDKLGKKNLRPTGLLLYFQARRPPIARHTRAASAAARTTPFVAP
jgi:hypothetical protein